MNGTSSGSDLQARLQKRAEQDRQQIEALTQRELKKLAENLRQSVNDEMYIIVRDIKNHTRWMNAALWGAWLRSVVVGGVSLSRHLGRELGPDKPGQPKSPVYSREVLSGTGTTSSVVKMRLAASSSKATPVNRSGAVQHTDPTKSDASVRVNISSMNTTQAAAGPFRSGNQRRHLLDRVL